MDEADEVDVAAGLAKPASRADLIASERRMGAQLADSIHALERRTGAQMEAMAARLDFIVANLPAQREGKIKLQALNTSKVISIFPLFLSQACCCILHS